MNVILEYNLPQNPKTVKNVKGLSFEQFYTTHPMANSYNPKLPNTSIYLI